MKTVKFLLSPPGRIRAGVGVHLFALCIPRAIVYAWMLLPFVITMQEKQQPCRQPHVDNWNSGSNAGLCRCHFFTPIWVHFLRNNRTIIIPFRCMHFPYFRKLLLSIQVCLSLARKQCIRIRENLADAKAAAKRRKFGATSAGNF